MSHKDVYGFTLLEVLLSLMILSLGSFAIAKIQILILQKDQQSYFHTVAATQAFSLAEVFYIQPQHIQFFIHAWNQLNKQLLPEGVGVIHENKITVNWKERDKNESVQFKI